jgi:23S rRNA pseudouridine2605 synthase
MERLQKLIAAAGLCSRRGAEEWIQSGRVTLNGRTARLGDRADLSTDAVLVDGRPLGVPGIRTYLILNKPAGYTTTRSDPHATQTVMDLIAGAPRSVFPVGRLDRETQGLLLLTDDGDLAFRLTHPRFGVEKTYRALVRGRPNAEALRRLSQGIELEDGMTAPARVFLRETPRSSGRHVSHRNPAAVPEVCTVELMIHEGRKRQVRRMLEAVGCPVLELERVRFGPLRLQRLPRGHWRHLTPDEVESLKRAVSDQPDSRSP